jgi:hypothetical protein
MNSNVVSLFCRYDYNIKSHLGKIGINNASIMSIVGFPFFTHEEVERCSDRTYERLCAVTTGTIIIAIPHIFCMF